MDVKITIRLFNLPNDTDTGHVEWVLRRQIAEHLDLDSHPEDIQLFVREIER
jgi:hypothetical protein